MFIISQKVLNTLKSSVQIQLTVSLLFFKDDVCRSQMSKCPSLTRRTHQFQTSYFSVLFPLTNVTLGFTGLMSPYLGNTSKCHKYVHPKKYCKSPQTIYSQCMNQFSLVCPLLLIYSEAENLTIPSSRVPHLTSPQDLQLPIPTTNSSCNADLPVRL